MKSIATCLSGTVYVGGSLRFATGLSEPRTGQETLGRRSFCFSDLNRLILSTHILLTFNLRNFQSWPQIPTHPFSQRSFIIRPAFPKLSHFFFILLSCFPYSCSSSSSSRCIQGTVHCSQECWRTGGSKSIARTPSSS